MRYISVCSGIEAATVAWHPLGWTPVAFAEIEPFASAVLAHHYPNVPNIGNIEDFRSWPDVEADVLVGGTPCQSFSVAGLRGGMADPRGNLALVYLAIADRYRPEWLLWENVPGVLSSSGGRDFGSFLGALENLGYHAAWRVLDAQYVRVDGFARAVPQRRRRVFVVGCAGDWRRAAAVLFERESLQGHPAPRRKPRESIAPTISARPTGGGGLGTDFDLDGGLLAFGGNNTSGPIDVATACQAHAGPHGRQDFGSETFVAHALKADGFDASEDGTECGTPLVPVAFAENSRAELRLCGNDGQVSSQLTTGGGKLGQGQPCIAQNWAVRRLTPLECERLQGFPDGYTAVPYRGKPAADGPRYKALGNSMAVNCMRWIGQGIEMVNDVAREIIPGVIPMDAERAPGPTFALEDVGFLDFETRGRSPITAGTYRYATEADAIICAYAIGKAPAQTIVAYDYSRRPLALKDMPLAFIRHQARVQAGTAVWAAWNAGFDRAIWNYATLDFPELEPHQIIDVMAQATASGLAPDLKAAAQQSGSVHKVAEGSKLIKLFCLPGADATPTSHPEEWKQFRDYAAGDVEALRSVFLGTRQLPLAEWREYWAMEAINQRGVGIDLGMVGHAAELAAEDRVRSRNELHALTSGEVSSVDQVARMTAWLLERLPAEGRAILTRREEEVNEEGELVRPAKFQLTRNRVERLIAFCSQIVQIEPQTASQLYDLRDVLRLLQIRLYGGSKTPAKFQKMLDSHVDGVLFGQYVFNGAAQTGRASSKGVQIHNLARDVLRHEHTTIEALLSGCSYDGLVDASPDPVARQLSLLIRPAFIPAAEDRVFVWSDWSQIEARILPWLAGDEQRLRIFRDVDADPKVPDLYTRTAANISHVPIAAVDKPIRQRGKVAELALGFAGGVGALQNMGAAYGLHLGDAEARAIVERWRAANQWCVEFWDALKTAADRALELPGTIQTAGRIRYTYKPDYLGGTLFAVLPSLRLLTYRDIRYERVADLDEDDKVVSYSTHLRFARGHGRVKLWHGMLCENAVQAVAADVLRGTLRRLEESGAFDVRLHTHDEVLLECPLEAAEHVKIELRNVMQQGFDWSQGLPLMSEETVGYYYSKSEEAHGL